MTRISVSLLIAFVGITFLAPAQTAFDVEAYKQFLTANTDLEYTALEQAHAAGVFLGAIPQPPATPAYLGAIASAYHLTPYERSLIEKHGFVVTSRLERPTFIAAFNDIFVRDLPVFVSTDALLYAVHLSYDTILRDLERRVLEPQIKALLWRLHGQVPALAASYISIPGMSKSVEDLDLYLTLPLQLLGEQASPHFSANSGILDTLHANIRALVPQNVRLFGSSTRTYDFSQFTVRGHYSRDSVLACYFRAMTWIGRTEFQLISPKGTSNQTPAADLQRQAIDGFLLRQALTETGSLDQLQSADQLLTFLLGESDNVTVDQLGLVAGKIALASPSELLDTLRLREFQDTLSAQPFAGQRIISQILIKDPFYPDQVTPSSAFLLLGQRFIIDGFITGNVVYDKIRYQGAEIRRMLPSSLDVLFALGNDASGQLLKEELEQYHYASNLAGLRYLIDSYDPSFWVNSLFNAWLSMIRALNPPADRSLLPPFMQTAAWWQEKLTTQLASWAQLRHDNILYGKQPYSVGIICSYPESYVEPVPLFYDRLHTFAGIAAGGLAAWPSVQEYFEFLANTADTLGSIARKELSGTPISPEERMFLRSMVRAEGICGNRYYGWYPRLLYGQEIGGGINDTLADYIVADVHTAPTDEFGTPVGWVKHVGTGPVEMGVFVAQTSDGIPMAFIGPVQTYYEHLTDGFKRITDEEWTSLSKVAPTLRPDWVNLYLADDQGASRGAGSTLVTSADEDPVPPVPMSIQLYQNFPNPFNAGTIISFSIGRGVRDSRVVLEVFDVVGKKVAALLDRYLTGGNYTIRWDGTGTDGKFLPSGVYIAKAKTYGLVQSRKMMILR